MHRLWVYQRCGRCGLEFKLSIALTLVALALVELLRQQWSGARFGMFAALIVLTYLTHLAAIVFIAAALGISALWGQGYSGLSTGKFPRMDFAFVSGMALGIYLFIPIIGVLAWHLVEAVTYRQPGDVVAQESYWGTAATKIGRLSWDLVRYHRKRDSVVMATLLAACSAHWRSTAR